MLTDEIAPQAQSAKGAQRVRAGVRDISGLIKTDESVTDPRAEGQVRGIAGDGKAPTVIILVSSAAASR